MRWKAIPACPLSASTAGAPLLGALAAAMALAGGTAASAQTAGAPSATAPAPPALWGDSTADATGSAASPEGDCDPSVRPGKDWSCPEDVHRRWRAHQEDLAGLASARAKEGPEYSEGRYRQYTGRLGLGISLVVVGFAGVVYGIAYGVTKLFSGIGSHGESEEHNDLDLGPEGMGIGMFAGGLALIGIGAPLAVSGASGRKRQDLLRRADEIEGPFDPFAVSLRLWSGDGRGGGLQVVVRL